MSRIFVSLATLSAAFGFACSDNNVSLGNNNAGYALVGSVLPNNVTDVDLLFVIDTSASMVEEQASLAQWAQQSLFGVLSSQTQTPLNLHIGVISADLGAADGIGGCDSRGGDNGIMQNLPQGNCTGPSDPYIIDVDDGMGGRITNYSGTLSETFSCIAPLGIAGCGFEQPLESMRRALDPASPYNTGFLRDDALLAVVFVTDEDDCSVSDPAFFGYDDSVLGPLSSFRCFEHGVICEDDPDPRAPGEKTNCIPRSDSPYITDVQEYIDFLYSLKSNPSMIVVAGIFGDPTHAEVVLDDMDRPQVGESCESSAGGAAPPIRLQAFLDGFPARSRAASICSEDMSGPLSVSAERIRDTVSRSTCLDGAVVDTDLAASGIQPDCRVWAAPSSPSTDSTAERTALPLCASGSDTACVTIAQDSAQCGHTPTGLAVDLSRAGDAAEGQHIIVECLSE